MVEASDVRRIWWPSETVHNVGYFAPEGGDATGRDAGSAHILMSEISNAITAAPR
jgi:hypothetical protein